MKWKVAVFLTAFLAVGLTCRTVTKTSDWWENASLYQIYPRSFQDSDGDGVRDLKGITSRLEYLKEIGITAIWLSPVFESPMADFGYDISNFTKIDATFGNLNDFDEMIAKAKQLGVKIILDFVPNHTSDECVWFQKSVNRDEGYEDFYVWDDGKIDPEDPSKHLPPSNWVSIFGGPMWTWNEQRQQFYLHQFLDKQPDLNYSNPLVHQHMLEVLKYWLDRGVAGFRIDAVHIYEKRNDDGSYPNEALSGLSSDPNSYDYLDHMFTKDQYPTIELMYEWRAFLKDYQLKNGGDSSSSAKDVENLVNDWMDSMWKNHKTANWVVGNHDSSRVADRIGRNKIDILNIIVNSLPGASITYYGEEIGMANVRTECTAVSCDNRDPERTPMQWDSTLNGGFSQSPTTWLPIADDYQIYNVETERKIGRSTLQTYKSLHNLKYTTAFKNSKGQGGFSFKAVTDKVFQIIRAVPGKEEYMTLVNLGEKLEYVENLSSKLLNTL